MKMRLAYKSMSRRAKWVMYPSMILALGNFAAFVAGSVCLGGDAINGFIKAGHYFVCAHGSCHQVSAQIWHFSYWHAISALLGILLIFAEAALFTTTGDIRIDWSKS
ncbi:MAG TPA: hypothetical protein VF269_07500 [Rhodanobacteraceae bacterium]